jgi:hypothetical protein
VNWEQLKTILWLRWRLTRRQWSRSGGVGAVLSVVVGVGAFLLAGGGFTLAFMGGMHWLRGQPPLAILAAWLGLTGAFLFFWLIGLMAELQRSETIDLQRLMHLPIRLGQMFVINYLVSHFALSIVVMVPAMLGLALGLAVGRGPTMALLIPLALATVFMVTAWTYCLRGWLAAMMANPRRRRTVMVVSTLVVVLVAQAPNFYFNILGHRGGHRAARHGRSTAEAQGREADQRASQEKAFTQFLAAQKFIPPFWLPLGAHALAEGRWLPAGLGTLGCLALGALGLRRAYRSTIRFYQGHSSGSAPKTVAQSRDAAPAETAARSGRDWMAIRLPLVPEAAAAVALASFRSMLRAPEVKMAWGTSFVVTLVAGMSIFVRAAPDVPAAMKPLFATGAMTFSIFLLVQFLANQFGFDRHGFRALVLAPVDRRWVLLGKNLACLPAGVVFGGVLLVLVAVWVHLPPPAVIAAVLQLVAMLLLAALGGNVLSILVPYRIEPGSMKPTKIPALALLVMLFCHLLFPVMMAPAFVPPLAEWLWRFLGWPAGVPVNVLLSLSLAGIALLAYRLSLGPLGRLLREREVKILHTVTVELE